MEDVLSILPRHIAGLVRALPESITEHAEEIRIRVNRPVEVTARGLPTFLPYLATEEDAEQIITSLARHSFYTLEEELMKGYITVEGGHRIGLAGKIIMENGRVRAIRQFGSFNIRVAREVIGVAEKAVSYIYEDGWKHTMIIGSPQTGKTTFLRDVARMMSEGDRQRGIPPAKVGIVDERSEIAGCLRGAPQLTFGPRIDVLDACPKAEGMMMMIRSMSPDVLIVDEAGREDDSLAIMEAINAGIVLVMTIHGRDLNEVSKRPTVKRLLEEKVFDRFIELERGAAPGTVKAIRNAEGQNLWHGQAGIR